MKEGENPKRAPLTDYPREDRLLLSLKDYTEESNRDNTRVADKSDEYRRLAQPLAKFALSHPLQSSPLGPPLWILSKFVSGANDRLYFDRRGSYLSPWMFDPGIRHGRNFIRECHLVAATTVTYNLIFYCTAIASRFSSLEWHRENVRSASVTTAAARQQRFSRVHLAVDSSKNTARRFARFVSPQFRWRSTFPRYITSRNTTYRRRTREQHRLVVTRCLVTVFYFFRKKKTMFCI